LNYIDFLREVGVHFSVNRMLTAECFKSRMEKGLSFLEFNYMLMQGYDFLYLHEHYGCKLELGGDDQWSNMLAGVDLIRRKKSEDAYAMTFALLTNSEGKKMGKTAKGALWLDASRTSPFEFYQYFRNVDDADVEKCMKLLTFMELEEIAELVSHKDERINAAKARLAWEVTALIHGKEAADEAEAQAKAAFSGDTAAMEAVKIGKDVTNIVDILVAAGLAPSKGEARRLVQGGGVKVGDEKVSDIGYTVTADTFVVHKGKKAHVKLERE
ncbi:MAG: tyrosine--tRNA ligase, partial [Clostridia bacterium]|nr:tyrosine--tRNA ligase [Clostridia bacterium]